MRSKRLLEPVLTRTRGGPMSRLCVTISVAVGVAASLPIQGYAQSSSVAVQSSFEGAVEGEYLPTVRLDPRPTGREDLKIGFSIGRIRVVTPLLFPGGTVLIPGVTYAGTAVQTSNDPAEDSPDSFHEIGLPLTILHPLNRKWSVLMNVTPAVATNFKDVDRDHFRFNGFVAANYRLSDTSVVGFGVLGNYAFGDLLPLPVARLDWTPSSAWHVAVFFPESARATVRLGSRVELGLAAFLQGNQYTVSDGDNPQLDSLKYTVVHGGATAALRLFGGLWLAAYGGHTVYRKFELNDEAGDEITSTEVANAPIVRVSLQLRQAPQPSPTANRQPAM